LDLGKKNEKFTERNWRTHRLVEAGEEEDDEDNEEEATTNKTDLKYIHDDDDDDDGEEEEFDVEEVVEKGVWLRLKALINGFCCINI